MRYKTNDFEIERERAVKAAKELYYGKEVIVKLMNAKSSLELDRILATARNAA